MNYFIYVSHVFVYLHGDTELARAVDVVMARAKRIYILIIKVNKLFFVVVVCSVCWIKLATCIQMTRKF